MSKKLHLIAGTLLTVALFVVFHAVLAITTVCWFLFLIPGMLFRWSTTEDRKPVPVRETGFGRH